MFFVNYLLLEKIKFCDGIKGMRLEDAEWNILREYYKLTPEEIFEIFYEKKIRKETKEKIVKGIRRIGVEDDGITISEFHAFPLVTLIRRREYEELKNIAENIGRIRIIGAQIEEDVPTYLRRRAEYVHTNKLHLSLPFSDKEIKNVKVYEVIIDPHYHEILRFRPIIDVFSRNLFKSICY